MKIGDKYQAKSGELMHVISMQDGEIQLRINGSKFVAAGPLANIKGMLKSTYAMKLSEKAYKVKLDEFWMKMPNPNERVEE